jgi:uncharacterized membrane protein YphA (DoxX/SURF4 family)
VSPLLDRLRETRRSTPLAIVRILLGLLFLTTGLMKLWVPELRAAFSGQLTAAAIPAHTLNMWFVPLAETGLGLALIAGFLSRVASLAAMSMMVVATYVHLVVHDPDLFPLQAETPIVPLIVLVLCAWVLWAGGGSWSADLFSRPGSRR